MKRFAALALAAGCFVQSPVMRFGGGKSAKEAQVDQAAKLTPPVLIVSDEGWHGPIASAKVRVYADDDYRAQNVRWRETFGEQLEYANEVLGPLLGVKLEAEYREWNRHVAGERLEDTLGAIRQHDVGNDVLTVVGLTSALSLVSATFEQLGFASISGRHMVLRGYAGKFERELFDKYFRELKPEDREALYHARRRHKTTALLLHELGHNLGVTHEAVADTIMNATYSDKSASFTPQARDTMLATLDARLGRKSSIEIKKQRLGAADKHPSLVVRIDAAGKPSVGGNVIDDATLDDLLRMSFVDDRNTQVVVKAAKGAPQSAVVKVLERAKAAGLTRLAIATDDTP
ncbi:MAG TPA: biopolymer transporter ExbD [Kofleriaceae bacterium]